MNAPARPRSYALLVQGGDALYLTYWMRQSGLADLLPSLRAVRPRIRGLGYMRPQMMTVSCTPIMRAAFAGREPARLKYAETGVSSISQNRRHPDGPIARAAADHLVSTVGAVRPPGATTPLVVTGGVAAGDHPVAGLLRQRLEARWPGCARAVPDGVAGATWLAVTTMPGAGRGDGTGLHQVICAQSR
jgi:hypothetical protein